jgi:hypothetical protein
MTDSDLKKIKDLVAAAETDTALETLAKLLSKNGEDKDYLDECIKIQGRYSKLTEQERRGKLSFSEFSIEQNKINDGIIEFLKQIEKGEKPGSLSFKKQNPLLFYTLHVVASLAICGLLGLFVNEGFVSGKEEWKLNILQKNMWFVNFLIVLLIGIIPAVFVVAACIQFFPFLIETRFTKELLEKGYFLPYGNAIYYIIPNKFVLLQQIIVSATLSFFALMACVLIFSFGIYILREIIHLSLGGQHISFGEFVRRNEDNGDNGPSETFAKHPFLCSFCILIAFFAYYAVGHPVAVTIYNFL